MNLIIKTPILFTDYLAIAKRYRGDFSSTANPDAFEKFAQDQVLRSRSCPVFFLTDLTRKRYAYMHRGSLQLSGYKAEQFLDAGLDFYFERMNKNDFTLYNRKIFPDYLQFLSTISSKRYSDFIFSRNNLFRKADGTYANLLQRFSFIADPSSGSPVAVAASVTDITPFADGNCIVQTIEENVNGLAKVVFRKSYFSEESLGLFTKTETEILKWMYEGLSSKQIAAKLCRSIHTIHNHRKNMLNKSSCGNTAELIRYGIGKKII